MSISTTNRPPERGHIYETSFIEGNLRGRLITAEDQKIIRAQSRLEDLYPDYDLEGRTGLNLKISKKFPGKIVAIGPKGG